MFTSRQFRNRTKIVFGAGILLVLLISLLLFVIIVRKQPPVNTPTQTRTGTVWRGVAVGLSTRNDIHATFGPPDISSSTTDRYCSGEPPCDDPEFTFDYDDNDILALIQIHYFGLSSLENIFHQYGNPQYQVRVADGPAFIYDSQGIIVDTSMKSGDDVKHAGVANLYFVAPCSIDCIIQQHWVLFPAPNPEAQPFATFVPG